MDSLPPSVARYLRCALPEEPSMHLVRMEQRGTPRSDTQSERLMAFEAEHLVAPVAVSFAWNARVTVAPLLHARS